MEAYIYDAVRTPRGNGRKDGALAEVKPINLLTNCLHAIKERNHLDTSKVNDFLVGCVTPTRDQGGNIGKAALLYADWDRSIPSLQLNRLSASGLDSVFLAATKIRSGWESLILAGGVESMSRVPIGMDGGPMVYDPAVNCKAIYVPRGISADLISTIEKYDRTQLDEYALLSQQRASHAQKNGYFKEAIVPIYDRNGLLILDKDELINPSITLENLSLLSPSFENFGKQGFDDVAIQKHPEVEYVKHIHTNGNSAKNADGAALLLIGNEEIGEQINCSKKARIVAAAVISNKNTIHLSGGITAARKVLKLAGLKIKDIDLWEIKEAFAATTLKFQQDLNIPIERLNINGGAIAMGDALGATGSMIIGKLMNELKRTNLKRGLASISTGVGMGIAIIIEIVD